MRVPQRSAGRQKMIEGFRSSGRGGARGLGCGPPIITVIGGWRTIFRRCLAQHQLEIGRRFRCGGIVTGSPKMMVQPCDVILTVQPSAAEVREVAFAA